MKVDKMDIIVMCCGMHVTRFLLNKSHRTPCAIGILESPISVVVSLSTSLSLASVTSVAK